MRLRATWVTTVVAMLALVALAATTFGSLRTIERSIQRVALVRAQASLLADARLGVAEEAFAEAGYRRSPGTASWERLTAANRAVTPRLAAASEGANRAEARALSTVRKLNDRYVAQIRRDRAEPGRPHDDVVAGPALDEMRALLTAAIDARRAELTQAVTEQATVIRRLYLTLGGVFLLATGALSWALGNARRREGRLRRDAARHREAAHTDDLTGLPNRSALIAAMRRNLVSGGEAALLFLDLDGFKPVNDTWGHAAGDAVLVEVGCRLQACVEGPDLVARLGGDEFAILLVTGISPDEVAVRVLTAFDDPFVLEDALKRVGVSIGIGETREVGHDPDTLLRAADRAVYRAKHAGGGRVARPTPV